MSANAFGLKTLPIFLVLIGCGPLAPARFADRPAVTEVLEPATDVPSPTPPLDGVYLSEVVIHGAFVKVLDPKSTPVAGDVNALDQVARSSWFWPGAALDGEGPPVPPLRVRAERPDAGPALLVEDSRGLTYVLRFDPPDRPEMRTGAAMIASRLFRDLGYFTPESHLIHITKGSLHGESAADVLGVVARDAAGYRAVALRWPPGVDLGPTSPSSTRFDDPNDVVPHRDRRSLRALRSFFAWLGVTKLDTHTLRDVYVGERGRGHTRHYLYGLDGALGADAVLRPEDCVGGKKASGLMRLLTLGFSVGGPLSPTSRECPAVGAFDGEVDLETFETSLPFAPMARSLPGDDYWAAKRLAELPEERVDRAIDAGNISDEEGRRRLRSALLLRRATVIGHGFRQVTPLEDPRVEGQSLELYDLAVGLGLAEGSRRYEVTLYTSAGDRLGKPATLRGSGATLRVPLPRRALESGYIVVELRVLGAGPGEQPRMAAQVHLLVKEGSAKVVGLRH